MPRMHEIKIDKFKAFLRESGAEILDPTNEYEVVRFRTENGVSVVYSGRKGTTFTGEAEEAYERLMSKNTWTITSTKLKRKRKALENVMERDGIDCFYCGKPTTEKNRTLEHLHAVINGGNNHVNNLTIACSDCNLAVGSLPIVEKIKYRDTLRGES